MAAFEDLERRSGGLTVSIERLQWYAEEDRAARHPEQFRPFLAGAIRGAAEVVAVDVKPDAVSAALA